MTAAASKWGPLQRQIADLTDEDRERLVNGFGIAAGDLDAHLEGVARASLQEYLDLFLGRGSPSTAKESRELRLLLLVKHVFNAMPPVNVVSDLFQLTTAQARTLVRNTRTRYRFELQTVLSDAVGAVIDAGKRSGDALVVEIRDDALLEYTKELVLRGKGNPPQIEAGEETHKYVLQPATERVLREATGTAGGTRR